MITIRGLRTLVRLKQRRVEQREDAVRAEASALASASDAQAQMEAREHSVRETEDRMRGRLTATTIDPQGFRANDVVTLQMLVNEAAQGTAEAVKATAAAAAQTDAAVSRLADAQRTLQRTKEQRERMQELLAAAIAAVDREQEDAGDEEAEETAVARMLARRRDVARSERSVRCESAVGSRQSAVRMRP